MVLEDVVQVQILVVIVPAYHVQVLVIVENVVREGAYLWQVAVSLHEVLLYVELEALLGSLGLVKASKNQDVFRVDRHAHSQITSSPGRLGVQVDHPPHVVVDIIHFNRVCDLLLVELGSARKHIDVFVVKNAGSCGVSGNVKVCDSAPGVVLDVIFFAGSVEALGVVSSNHED